MNDSTNVSGGDYIDYNLKTNAYIQWLEESRFARDDYQLMLYRVALAMQGKPWKNLYQEELKSNISKIGDMAIREKCEKSCVNVPEGRDFTLAKAVQTRANQMAGGVDTYEYTVDDPYGICDPETEDLLSAKCKQDYLMNELGLLAPTFSRDLSTAALTAVEVRYDPVSDKNMIRRIAPKNVFFDTKYSSTGQERFRGYNTMISWKKLKKMIEDDPNEEINKELKVPDRSIFSDDGKTVDKTAKYSNRKIRTLNGLDIYVQDMNRLASSSQLARDAESFMEFRHDLIDCYNTNWYQSLATNPKARTASIYGGDDVELTVLYDLIQKCEVKIINRRYVISVNRSSFHRKIVFEVENPVTGEIVPRIDDFCMPCPLVFQYDNQENRDVSAFPISSVMRLLDYHDQLCAWRAKREHVARILSILRVETNGGDAESLRGIMNIMGIVLDDIQGDISSISFAYDWTAIDTEISYLQKEIREVLNAYTDFDAMQAMGDRASAAETGAAIGAVAQGLATHQNAIMNTYAEIARLCIANRVAYSPEGVFTVMNKGEYAPLTAQQMALTATIDVKSVLSKKVREKMAAANAMTLIGSLQGILTPAGIAYFSEQAMYGSAPRKMIESFIKPAGPSEAEKQTASLEAQNMARQLDQNEQAYAQNPMQYEAENVMDNPNNSPEDIDAIIAGIGGAGMPALPNSPQGGRGEEEMSVEAIDVEQQPGAVMTDLPNQTPDMGGLMSNPNSMV